MKLKNIANGIKSFGFNLLPEIVQQFFIWKYHIKDESDIDFNTGFKEFLSAHLNHGFKSLYVIMNKKDEGFMGVNKNICMCMTHEAAEIFFRVHNFNKEEHQICKVDLSLNIIEKC